jgi:ribosomal protein S18 acetylase RimI-like enzyme
VSITIHNGKTGIAFSEITELTEVVGWGRNYYKTEAIWQRILDKSSHIVTIRHHDQLISFGRILEDGIMCMFYDICVHPDYQRQGHGSSLMNQLIQQIKDEDYISIGLFVWNQNPGAKDFYHRLGFEPSSGMELKLLMKTANLPDSLNEAGLALDHNF